MYMCMGKQVTEALSKIERRSLELEDIGDRRQLDRKGRLEEIMNTDKKDKKREMASRHTFSLLTILRSTQSEDGSNAHIPTGAWRRSHSSTNDGGEEGG